ncbi:MAG: dihydroneopterin aldolase, partial [Sulfurimonas sp.]|nr:dihydroneopterin aldolase [Sulfurimonas sp.]
MTIHIQELKFQCIIGILDFERVTSQDVIIDITIDYEYENNFINYAQIVQLVKEIMIKNEFLLIEEALNNLNLKLTKEFSSIKGMFIKIT